MNDREIEDKFKEILTEQPLPYVLASLFRLAIKNTKYDKNDYSDILESIKGGWY